MNKSKQMNTKICNFTSQTADLTQPAHYFLFRRSRMRRDRRLHDFKVRKTENRKCKDGENGEGSKFIQKYGQGI